MQDFQAKAAKAEKEIIEELPWQGLRLVVAHHPERAIEQMQLRSVTNVKDGAALQVAGRY